MSDLDLDRLYAEATTVGKDSRWVSVNRGHEYYGECWQVVDEAVPAGAADDVVCTMSHHSYEDMVALAAYVAAVQPSAVVAMVRRIRELEYLVAKSDYRKACAWITEAREWGGGDGEMAEAEADAATAKARVDDAAARVTAVGGNP